MKWCLWFVILQHVPRDNTQIWVSSRMWSFFSRLSWAIRAPLEATQRWCVSLCGRHLRGHLFEDVAANAPGPRDQGKTQDRQRPLYGAERGMRTSGLQRIPFQGTTSGRLKVAAAIRLLWLRSAPRTGQQTVRSCAWDSLRRVLVIRFGLVLKYLVRKPSSRRQILRALFTSIPWPSDPQYTI